MKTILSFALTLVVAATLAGCVATSGHTCGCNHSDTHMTCSKDCKCGCHENQKCTCGEKCECAKHATQTCPCHKK